MRSIIVVCCLAVLAGCGGGSPPPNPETRKEPERMIEIFRGFPKEDLVTVRMVEAHLMGKPFLPAGSVAEYRNGKTEHTMFVAQFENPNDAAIALLDYKKSMTESKLVPAFGGYFGQDGGRPVFVFAKGKWLAGIAGLNEKEVDLPARQLASAL